MKSLTAVLAAVVLADATLAQSLNTTIGPTDAPLGTPIAITACNDTPGYAEAYGCHWAVYDENWSLVYDPDTLTWCSLMSLFVGPWGWHTLTWEQVDMNGDPVAPGLYRILNQPPGGSPTVTEITIGEAQTSLWLEGTPIVHPTLSGQRRNFALSSPADPGRMFVQWIGNQGPSPLRTCAGPLPIAVDGLAFPGADLGAPTASPMICGATGVLDANGYSTQPTLCPPDDAALIGRTFTTAFMVLDPTVDCSIVRVSKGVEFELGG